MARCSSGGGQYGHIYCYDNLPKVLRSCPRSKQMKKVPERFVVFSKQVDLLKQADSVNNKVNQMHQGQIGFRAQRWEVFNLLGTSVKPLPPTPVYIQGDNGRELKNNYMFMRASKNKGYIGEKYLMPFNDNSGSKPKWRLRVGKGVRLRVSPSVQSRPLPKNNQRNVFLPECMEETLTGDLWVRLQDGSKKAYVLLKKKVGENYITIQPEGALQVVDGSKGSYRDSSQTEAGSFFHCESCSHNNVKKQLSDVQEVLDPVEPASKQEESFWGDNAEDEGFF